MAEPYGPRRRAEAPYRDADRGPTMAGMIQPRPITHTSPHPGLPQPLRVVLLAADARPADRATVDRAIALAAREHAKLVALHVLPGDHGSQLRDTDGPVPSELERIVNRARRAGVEARHLVRFGEVGREILRTARELDADLIVVGSSPGCGYVLTHGDRPILVVHPWADVGPDWEEAVLQSPARAQAGDRGRRAGQTQTCGRFRFGPAALRARCWARWTCRPLPRVRSPHRNSKRGRYDCPRRHVASTEGETTATTWRGEPGLGIRTVC